MALRAKRDLRAGEEVLVSYGYTLPFAPAWYQEQWFQHVRREGWGEARLRAWCGDAERRWGAAFLYVPPVNNE